MVSKSLQSKSPLAFLALLGCFTAGTELRETPPDEEIEAQQRLVDQLMLEEGMATSKPNNDPAEPTVSHEDNTVHKAKEEIVSMLMHEEPGSIDFEESPIPQATLLSEALEMSDEAATHGLGTKGFGMGGMIGSAANGVSSRARKSAPQTSSPRPLGTFTDHGLNPFTLSSDDALSTFSIDVDTASYTVSRRLLNEGTLPPAASVRAEEFVNYFSSEDRAPSMDDPTPFSVTTEGMADPFRDGHHILRIGIQGVEVDRDNRDPIHLTFLVDVSGSMSSPDKLGLAKKALHMLVDNLREDDTVAIATYAGRTAKLLAPTSAGEKRIIHDVIEALDSRGSTAMSAGIDIAYDLANEGFQQGHENRVVVLSDGDANVGRTSWEDMLAQIKSSADSGITLSTIGFGMGNYRDTLMEQLANKGDGNNFYIDSEHQAKRVFVDQIGGTLITIARDTKIQVEFNDEAVSAYRLIGYENRDIADKDFRNDKVDAGEIGAGHHVTALYDVVLSGRKTDQLATVRVRWEKPGADGTAAEEEWNLASSSISNDADNASTDIRVAYTAGTFAEKLRGSRHTKEISFADLTDFAEASRQGKNKDLSELIGLIKTADRLSTSGQREDFTNTPAVTLR